MRYHVLACDYDGTLAHHGRVDEPSLAALERLRATGRKLVMVTGRQLDELLDIFPEVGLFEWIVAENGALLYRPAGKEAKLLGEPPPAEFVRRLGERGVTPLSVGRVIVATWHPHETVTLEVIREQGLDLQVIFNKDAVMVLPAGVTKASGLLAALKELGLSPHETVGVGDAENDHAFLALCECSAAVANALPAVKDRADLVTRGDHGPGVTELIERILATDLREFEGKLTRHHLLLGTRSDGVEVRVPPYGVNLLIAGPSGSGKSTVCTALLEQLASQRYQYAIIDPEGDYDGLAGAVTLGSPKAGPTADEVLQVLRRPTANVVVNLVGLPLADRPPFFLGLLTRLQEMQAHTGRPHWLVVDEAHHLLPTSWVPGQLALPAEPRRVVFVTVHPGQVAPAALDTADFVVAVGPEPAQTLGEFGRALGEPVPPLALPGREDGTVVVWGRYAGGAPYAVRPVPSRTERRRHTRKYAEGELPPDRSFYFRGPQGKLKLRAQNLILFLQLADGVDDETWTHHLRQGDYSRWFRQRIKDEELAAEAAEIEGRADLTPAESRALVRQAVERLYTLPASTPLPMPGTDAAPARASDAAAAPEAAPTPRRPA
jgi:hydroxymethylpyrimidine pyrophosphatase-like HAD family hydrolase